MRYNQVTRYNSVNTKSVAMLWQANLLKLLSSTSMVARNDLGELVRACIKWSYIIRDCAIRRYENKNYWIVP